MAPSSCTSLVPIFFTTIGAFVKGTKGGPSYISIGSGPHLTCWPTSSIWVSVDGTPYSSTSLDSRSCPSHKRCSLSIIRCGIGSYQSLCNWKTLYPPLWKWSQDFCLVSRVFQCILIPWKKILVGRGKWGGSVRTVKVTVLWVMVICMQPHLYHSPNKF